MDRFLTLQQQGVTNKRAAGEDLQQPTKRHKDDLPVTFTPQAAAQCSCAAEDDAKLVSSPLQLVPYAVMLCTHTRI